GAGRTLEHYTCPSSRRRARSAGAHRQSAGRLRYLERTGANGADVDRLVVRLGPEIPVEVVLRRSPCEDAAVSRAGYRAPLRREVGPGHRHQVIDLTPAPHTHELEAAVAIARMREVAAGIALAQIVVARRHAPKIRSRDVTRARAHAHQD